MPKSEGATGSYKKMPNHSIESLIKYDDDDHDDDDDDDDDKLPNPKSGLQYWGHMFQYYHCQCYSLV